MIVSPLNVENHRLEVYPYLPFSFKIMKIPLSFIVLPLGVMLRVLLLHSCTRGACALIGGRFTRDTLIDFHMATP